MTSPTEPTAQPPTDPAAPPGQNDPPSAPGTPQPGAPPEPGQPGATEPEDAQARLQRAEAALADERRQRREAERQLAEARRQTMPEAERALAAAREEGATEARRAAGAALAAAEFRAAAVGVLADPDAALDALDLSRFVNDHGEVDRRKIGDLVKRLAAALPAAANAGRIPAGSRGTPANDDFLRSAMRPGR